MLFAGAGLVWLIESLFKNADQISANQNFISLLILLLVFVTFANNYFRTQQASIRAHQNALPEQYAADFLASHIQDGDKILSVSPVDMRTAYYLFMNGIPYNIFYQRDHPEKFQNALLVLRTNSKYNTPESLLDFFQLTSNYDAQTAQLIFTYGPLHVFSVPPK